jgi:SP family sugar:H+ symporter-like MFS transporter
MLLFKDFINRFGQSKPDGTIEIKPIIASLIVSLISIGCLLGALSGA